MSLADIPRVPRKRSYCSSQTGEREGTHASWSSLGNGRVLPPDFSEILSPPTECGPAERRVQPTARLRRVAVESDLLDAYFLSLPDARANRLAFIRL